MEEQHEQQFTKGFNSGYLLAKHEPALAAQLAASPNEKNPYYEGLIGGKEEYEKEVREWSKSFGRGGPANDQREQERDR